MASPLVRFAPSPTGLLHVGNVRTALINWLFARANGGRFFLRLDDTDRERSREEFARAIEDDLEWLGLAWDGFQRQSDRHEAYEAARRNLLDAGRLYACYETPDELETRRKLQAGRGKPPVYDRAALKLTDAQKAAYEAQGRKPHYRFLLADESIAWDDLIRGPVNFAAGHMSDPVLWREDGVPLYTIASVVDDGEMGVTHVIRGEDHVSNTAVQLQIFAALGFTEPAFGHLALLRTKEGELSKRAGGSDIRSLRDAGFEPMAVNSLLAKIGTSDPVAPFSSLEALTAAFDLKRFGRAPAIYDIHELERVNGKLLHELPFSAVRSRLPYADEAFWLAVRGNIKTLADARHWWEVIYEAKASRSEDPEFLKAAASLLPSPPWDEGTWSAWTKILAEKTGRKGKSLFMPLRLALTGEEHGPEMKALLPLFARETVLRRLGAAA